MNHNLLFSEKMVSDNAAMALDDYIAKSKIGKGGRGGNRGGGRSRGKNALSVVFFGLRFGSS